MCKDRVSHTLEKEKRIRNLSTRYLKWVKGGLFVLYTVILIAFSYYFIVHRDGIFWTIYFLGVYGYLLYLLYRVSAKLQHVEFDEEHLYVVKRNVDYLIPLENIESVEIVSLGGVYKVNLYRAEQLGKEFYFKPSLFYPLNYKKKDLLVNQLRKNIDMAKQKKVSLPYNALMS